MNRKPGAMVVVEVEVWGNDFFVGTEGRRQLEVRGRGLMTMVQRKVPLDDVPILPR